MVLSSFSVFLAALNFSLSITAFLGNVVILFALRKVNSIRPQTKLLFQCLAVTDLAVGLTTQPLLAISFIPGAVEMNTILYLLRYQVSVSMGIFFCPDNDRNMCGQASRSSLRAAISSNCHIQACPTSSILFLVAE